MRRLLLLLALALPLHADLWGKLEQGPYAVGLTQWERYDHARLFRTPRKLDGTPRSGELARPIRVTIWYPAEKSNAKRLTFGDYADMIASEATFAPVSDAQKKAAEDAFFRSPLLNTLNAEQRAAMRALSSRAVRDAKPVAGKFPLILYSLGSNLISQVTPEYLASHGYVVVSAPRLGAFAGLPQDNRDGLDLETKLRDIDFLLNAIADFPQVDANNIGAVGFSAGGRWALAAAMKYPTVRAVVSLDSVMLFEDPTTAAWRTMTHYDPDAVRVPVLHMVRAAFAKQENPKLWEAMRYADRTYMLFEDPDLDHWDFQSLGYATALAGARGAKAEKVSNHFHTVTRQTLAFLNANLKGGAYKAEGGDRITHLAAQPAPMRLAEFLGALQEENANAAIAAYRGGAPLPEQALNLAGYNLLAGGRIAEAIAVFTMNAESYPTSANTLDSLADAYLAAGNREKAIELAKKANELLAKETAITPERRAAVQASIDAKLR